MRTTTPTLRGTSHVALDAARSQSRAAVRAEMERAFDSADAELWGHFGLPALLREQLMALEAIELATSPVFLAGRGYDGKKLPRGDGRTVMVIPGIAAGDAVMLPMAYWLGCMNYDSELSGIELNAGMATKIARELERRVEREVEKNGGEPITLVGHSLGGVYARVLAAKRPDLINHIVTLGSPLVNPPQNAANPIIKLAAKALLLDINTPEAKRLLSYLEKPLPKDTRIDNFFSKKDGVVAWQSEYGKDPGAKATEIRGATHSGMVVNPRVYEKLAHVLADAHP